MIGDDNAVGHAFQHGLQRVFFGFQLAVRQFEFAFRTLDATIENLVQTRVIQPDRSLICHGFKQLQIGSGERRAFAPVDDEQRAAVNAAHAQRGGHHRQDIEAAFKRKQRATLGTKTRVVTHIAHQQALSCALNVGENRAAHAGRKRIDTALALAFGRGFVPLFGGGCGFVKRGIEYSVEYSVECSM